MAVDDPASTSANARLDELVDLATPLGVRTVVTLRIPDQIAAGVHHLDDLAKSCDADPPTLARLLRFLVHRGVFAEESPDSFTLTDVGELLCDRSGRRPRRLPGPRQPRLAHRPGLPRAAAGDPHRRAELLPRCTAATTGPTWTPTRRCGPTSTS